MYSVILAALISTGTDQTQGWHHCHGCWGCHGCHSCSCGGCWGGCWGYAYGGCSCYGCSCYGCSCSCSSFGCCSCYSGCSGCTGLWTAGYAHWCTGCYGSWCSGYAGTGWTFYSGPTCAGGVCGGVSGYAAVTTPPGYASYSTPAPSYASVPAPSYASVPAPVPSYASVSTPVPVVARASAAPAAPVVPAALTTPAPTNDYQTVAARISPAGAPARVVVNLPIDSKLWVEQVACPLTGERRAFNTASLQPGSRYFYNLTVESVEGTRQTRRIELTPGQTTQVDFRTVATVQR
jgi:uncharacterized protein (TIGR03000 family)